MPTDTDALRSLARFTWMQADGRDLLVLRAADEIDRLRADDNARGMVLAWFREAIWAALDGRGAVIDIGDFFDRALMDSLRARLALGERAVTELAYIHAAETGANDDLIRTGEGRAILADWEALRKRPTQAAVAEWKQREAERAAIEELRNGDGVYYVTQERAFAPGIAGEWPDVIPHGKNGRIVKRQWPRGEGA